MLAYLLSPPIRKEKIVTIEPQLPCTLLLSYLVTRSECINCCWRGARKP